MLNGCVQPKKNLTRKRLLQVLDLHREIVEVATELFPESTVEIVGAWKTGTESKGSPIDMVISGALRLEPMDPMGWASVL